MSQIAAQSVLLKVQFLFVGECFHRFSFSLTGELVVGAEEGRRDGVRLGHRTPS
jgi:hypothetical protein